MERAEASGPFTTDSPQIEGVHKLSVEPYFEGQSGDNGGADVGTRLEYGLSKSFSLSAAVPLGFSAPNRVLPDFSMSEMELGFRYVAVSETGMLPAIALTPSVTVPLKGEPGQSGLRYFLPAWAQKELGGWTIFGGGGLGWGGGPETRQAWFAGAGVTRQVTEALQLGAEVYHQTADSLSDTENPSGFGIGGTYAVSKTIAVDFIAGAINAAGDVRATYFIGVNWEPLGR